MLHSPPYSGRYWDWRIRYAILCYVIFTSSLCYVLILEGLKSAPPMIFGGLRTIFGGIALLTYSALSNQGLLPERKYWKWIFWVGLTTSLTFGSMFLSPGFVGAGLAAILGNTQPLFIAFFAFFFLKEQFSSTQIFALGLAFVGVLFIISPSIGGEDNALFVGSLLALVTSLAAASGTIIGRHLKLTKSLLPFTAWQLLLGGIGLVVMSLLLNEPATQWSGEFVIILVLLGVFNSAIVTCAWFWLLRHETAASLGSYLFLVPVLGVFWAYLFQNEQLPISSAIGGLLVILGVFCQELKQIGRWMHGWCAQRFYGK